MSILDKFRGPQSEQAPDFGQDWRDEFVKAVERDSYNWGVEDFVINYWPGKETFTIHVLFDTPGYKAIKQDTGQPVPLRFDYEVLATPESLAEFSAKESWEALLMMFSSAVAQNKIANVDIVPDEPELWPVQETKVEPEEPEDDNAR